MARMQSPQSRVSFGAPEDDIKRLDEIADSQDKSRSELLRELVREEIERHEDDQDGAEAALPETEHLREAYLSLLDVAEERIEGAGLRITREEARNTLWSNRCPKDAVMDSLIRPLRKRGFVDIDPGMDKVWITVRPLEGER